MANKNLKTKVGLGVGLIGVAGAAWFYFVNDNNHKIEANSFEEFKHITEFEISYKDIDCDGKLDSILRVTKNKKNGKIFADYSVSIFDNDLFILGRPEGYDGSCTYFGPSFLRKKEDHDINLNRVKIRKEDKNENGLEEIFIDFSIPVAYETSEAGKWSDFKLNKKTDLIRTYQIKEKENGEIYLD